MIRRRAFLAGVAALAWFCAGTRPILAAQGTAPQAIDPAIIANKAARNYKALSSFQAEFKITVLDKDIGDETYRGALYLVANGRWAMYFTDPPKQLYLFDGTHQWLANANTPNQVNRNPVTSTSGAPINIVGMFFDNPVEKYTLSYVKTSKLNGKDVDVILMTPKARMQYSFRSAEVTFDRGDGLPRRIDMDEVGNRKVMELTRIWLNRTISDSIFKFKVGNLKVITP